MIVNGPMSPFGNVIPAIEASVEIITNAIEQVELARAEEGMRGVVEATREAEDDWVKTCKKSLEGTLFNDVKGSWFTGGNIPGKVVGSRAYFAGMKSFRDVAMDVTRNTWNGFKPL